MLLHHFLVRSALHMGSAIAVEEEGNDTTFNQLLHRSQRLAAFFKRRGLCKGDRVVLLMQKSTDSIVSLFATLFNGCIYVPLDPRWPPERIESTLRDCAPRLAVLDCSGELIGRIPSLSDRASEMNSGPVIVDVDGGCVPWRDAIDCAGSIFEETAVNPEDPALILFTSGSTGRPKGVTLSHRAVAVFVHWAIDAFGITEKDRLACPSPLSFDLSTLDIYAMGLRQAACVIVPEEITWMPKFLTQFTAERRISVWYSAPSLLSAMLLDGGLGKYRFPELRVVAFAGEVFPGRHLERWRAVVPGADYYNLYGPTETNVVAWYHVPSEFDYGKPIPIGRACPYAELILDPEDARDDDQNAGRRLLVRGESVMTGYWNRPEETDKAFIEIADSRGLCSRFYRTGDRVLADVASGGYVFIGREDRQVKRRGYRIELGEIEAILSRHPGVLDVAVTSVQDSSMRTVIAAFVRLDPNASVSQVELRVYGAGFLPAYMMPDRIIPLQFIPRGSRGKIDYEALRLLLQRS
jgi:amino acid adenylation domain-containing protein